MMTAEEIAAWDEKRSRELDVHLAVEAHCRRCDKGKPPSPERIAEVSEAVLKRRIQAALDELKRRRAK